MANDEIIDIPQLRGRGSRIAAKRVYRTVRLASGELATQLVAAKGQRLPDGLELKAGEAVSDGKAAQDHAKRGPRSTARKAGPKSSTKPSA